MPAPEDGELFNWVLGAVVTVIGTLAAVVAHLYKITQTQNSKEIEELKLAVRECEVDREELRVQLIDVKVRLAKLESDSGRSA